MKRTATHPPRIVLVDVGHGNCALVIEPDHVTIIDAGRGGILLDVLAHYGIQRVNTVLISHADEDHIGGLEPLLLQNDILIDHVFLNSAESRGTEAWMALRRAVSRARARGTAVHVGLAVGTSLPIEHSNFEVEILAPLPENALGGERGVDVDGKPQSPNSTSAVIRISAGGSPLVLLAGDIDAAGLRHLLSQTPAPKAKLLVFPHHGGLPAGEDPGGFASDLVGAVEPSFVVFSVARSRPGFPRPEIVAAVRTRLPDTHIVCTQLSRLCAASVPTGEPIHLATVPSRGREHRACCGGSLILIPGRESLLRSPTLVGHADFIRNNAPTALCVME